jgi:hypothetical protein
MERHEGAVVRRAVIVSAVVLGSLLMLVPGTTLYFESGNGTRCTTCHEMGDTYGRWHNSSHRGIACEKCHGGALTADPKFHLNNASRVVAHIGGELPERIAFGNDYVQNMTERCQSCHRQEYASWAAGPHSATYRRIFTDKAHNSKTMLMDDCLRCHGMHFEGGINNVVSPVGRSGPWQLAKAEMANMATMPCLTCHAIHREGPELRKAGEKGEVAGPSQEIARPSLAYFDRRSQRAVPVSDLPLPNMLEGERVVRMSKDQRQALCYQCHAPAVTMQVGSDDDRTGIGVHEGISCLSCHAQHGQTTRASCATCHPKMSNCGLDVEKMDTTFLSKDSRHNIHRVKCVDCHANGIPRKKESKT